MTGPVQTSADGYTVHIRVVRNLFLVVLVFAAATLALVQPLSLVMGNHGATLHNAVRKKDVANYGSYALIAGTNPNLNGGQWAYFRVSSYKLNPACPQGRCYSEIGWWKKSDGTFKGLLVWENPSYNQMEFTYTQGQTHSFTNVYIPASGKWAFYYDGSWIWEDSMGYTSADLVFCGGEVATGVENMTYTLCGNGLGTA